MKKLGLKARLIIVICFLTLLMVGVGLLGYKGISDGENALESTYADQVLPLLHLKVVYDNYAVHVVDGCHKVAGGTLAWDEGRKSVAAARDRADQAWKTYQQTSHGGEEKRLLDELIPLSRRLDAAMDRLADILQKEDHDQLKAFDTVELYVAVDP
ncbi:MAG TPA: Tar ligand binding domain-containing protein, partial [Roseimicrobium sp.]|nr:Tar ligand binding domain-containing protein [Roseimicrobium sp.]